MVQQQEQKLNELTVLHVLYLCCHCFGVSWFIAVHIKIHRNRDKSFNREKKETHCNIPVIIIKAKVKLISSVLNSNRLLQIIILPVQSAHTIKPGCELSDLYFVNLSLKLIPLFTGVQERSFYIACMVKFSRTMIFSWIVRLWYKNDKKQNYKIRYHFYFFLNTWIKYCM